MRLFLAATSLELRGLLKRCCQIRVERVQAVWGRSAVFQNEPVLLLANGAGAERAYAAIRAARNRNPAWVCNVGFCGALDPVLRVGDIVIGDSGSDPGNRRRYVTGALKCSDHVVQTVLEKRALHEAGYIAVDMESNGALAAAHELKIPFYAVKAVSDLATEELRCDYNRALRDDGSIDVMNLSLQAMARPLTCLPDLVRFGRNAFRATECMGEFLAGCEFGCESG